MRVLHVYPQLNNAGTERVILNLYRHVDRSQLQFDFLTQRPGELDEVVRAMGAEVHCLAKTQHYADDLLSFFSAHPEYRVIHAHTHAEMGMVLRQARRAGVPHRIAHSHNSRSDLPAIMKCYKLLSSWSIEQHANHFVACSTEAAAWLFPRKHGAAQVWRNGIDVQHFQFDPGKRRAVRSQLRIPENAKVVCHVGRLARQKNHRRILSLLNQLTRQDESIYGLLIGTGPLDPQLRSAAQSPHIQFLGSRTDVADLLCAADVFLFPSLHEGLGIAAVEAQACGLPCIASTNVPDSADIGAGLFTRLPLSAPDQAWLGQIERSFQQDMATREARSQLALSSAYQIETVAAAAQRFYLSLE